MENKTFNGEQKIKLTQIINEGMQIMHEIETLNGGLSDTIKAVAEELEIKSSVLKKAIKVAHKAEFGKTQQEQELFKRTADLLVDDKITPEQACSVIEKLRDAGIIADDILDPTEPEEKRQKGFNEIAGLFADWKITTE